VDAPARFTRDDQPGARWLIVSGEIDLGVADALIDAMTHLVRDADGHAVVDLRRVTFLNSTGVNVLAAASTDAAARGLRLLLWPSPQVRNVLELTDLDEHFEFVTPRRARRHLDHRPAQEAMTSRPAPPR